MFEKVTVNGTLNCVATCRPGLEAVLAREAELLGGRNIRTAKRAVHFSTGTAGLYRMNMALRTAIQVLVPLRTFNAKDYQLLYYQARKTNWHQYFTPDKTLRIDVNGHSDELRNTQYVIHRVKDGIVDTFRKLSGGVRPSIDKDNPDIHIMVHLNGQKVSLYLDSAGAPLFKRGYRTRHGGAPLKEDLAAGILQLCGIENFKGVVDPMCGSGTFLFEAWMLMNNIAPNLERAFAFENWHDYQPDLHEKEKLNLLSAAAKAESRPVLGSDIDPAAIEVADAIRQQYFPEAAIQLEVADIRESTHRIENGLTVTNPPYGERMGKGQDLGTLYREIAFAARRITPGGTLALFTANRKAAKAIPFKSEKSLTLFNGAIEGLLYQYSLHSPSSGVA